MSRKARAGVIPTAGYRCECGGQRHKCDIERIEKLESEVARLKEGRTEIAEALCCPFPDLTTADEIVCRIHDLNALLKKEGAL